MSAPSVRAQLRLANRDAWRHKSRSFLIVATLTLPVAGVVAALTLVHSLAVSPATKATWQMGTADATLWVNDDGNVSPAQVATNVKRAVPAGSATLVYGSGTSRVMGPDGLLRQADISDLPYEQPLGVGMVHQLRGRAPRAADEVAVADSLARAGHLAVGSRLLLRDVDGGRTATVVGIAQSPSALGDQQVWVSPGLLTGTPQVSTKALVRLPAGTDARAWAAQRQDRALARYSVLHPHSTVSAAAASASTGLKLLVAGLALLEAVLMAGAAFGVGARRSQHDLALLAATGGDAAQVRGVVLSAALVLGAIAGVAGTALGLLAAQLLLPLAHHFTDHAYAGLRLRPVELLGAALLGVVTALLSAWLPARGAARAPVVASLHGRRGVLRTSRTRIGLALTTAAFGTLCCAWAGRTHSLGDRQFDAILLFAAVAELGFAGCAPSLVGATGKLGGRASLTMRLSLRDISRNRNRTGPAVAAIMATLSGVVAMGVYTASQHARHVADYVPTLPPNTALAPGIGSELPAAAVQAVSASLGASAVYPVGDAPNVQLQLGGPALRGNPDLTIAGPGLLTALGIPQAAPALAAGKVVVINGSPVDNGVVGLSLYAEDGTTHERSLPAVAAEVGNFASLGAAIISPATATSLGIDPETDGLLWTTDATPTQHQIDAANALLLSAAPDQTTVAVLQVETGLDEGGMLLVPLALLAISTLVTFGVTAIATALSAAESKADFATLSAVGATAFVRRKLAMAQAGVLALLGGVLGIAAGLVPVTAVIAVRSDVLTLTIPWQVVALALVGVPAIAAVGAGLFTRSRLPMTRQQT